MVADRSRLVWLMRGLKEKLSSSLANPSFCSLISALLKSYAIVTADRIIKASAITYLCFTRFEWYILSTSLSHCCPFSLGF